MNGKKSGHYGKGKSKENLIMGAIILIVLALGIYAISTLPPREVKETPQQVATVEQMAQSADMTVSAFLEEYGLPADLSANTDMQETYQMMTLENAAKFNGVSTEEFMAPLKDDYGLGDYITSSNTIGEVMMLLEAVQQAQTETEIGAPVDGENDQAQTDAPVDGASDQTQTDTPAE